ncbi:unnamed protein product [Caenorhabditis sp. 36 PRJEB53466]|nr:unnamed protein product [Caenorhabditis sp. 36 PRJEB53466]
MRKSGRTDYPAIYIIFVRGFVEIVFKMTESYSVNETSSADKIKTIRGYYKLCQTQQNRGTVLRDKLFFTTLPTLLKDDSCDVIRYTSKILVLLTEQSHDSERLLESSDLLSALSTACESSSPGSKELDRGGTIHRKFVCKKSKQITLEFDPEEFNEIRRNDVERVLLKKKGVISVYITDDNVFPRAVLRTAPTIDAKEIFEAVFSVGLEYIAQIVKSENKEEKFEMYAANVQKGDKLTVPDYLDDEIAVTDPMSCVVTNDMINHGGGHESGWLSSLASFVKTSLW